MINTPPRKRRCDSTLTVYSHLSAGGVPSVLWKKKILTEDQVKYSLTVLRREGYIRKVAYGTWEILRDYQGGRRWKKVHRMTGIHTPPEGVKPDTARTHGIQAVVRIPQLPGWDNRAEILDKSGIEYIVIPQGQRIKFLDIEKVWLTSHSIVFNLPYSWYAETAQEGIWQAMRDMLDIIMKLEKFLKVSSFKRQGRYWIRFSKQHQGLIKNALARQYNKNKEKLFVYDEHGLWLLIDDSYQLGEVDAVHPNTATHDHGAVQNFFNSVKKNPGATVDFILRQQVETREDLRTYARDAAAHAGFVRTMAVEWPKLTCAFDGINETIKGLKDAIRGLKHGAAPEVKPTGIHLEILQDTGDFVGFMHDGKTLNNYNLKRGAKIYMEPMTAKALVKNGKAQVIV